MTSNSPDDDLDSEVTIVRLKPSGEKVLWAICGAFWIVWGALALPTTVARAADSETEQMTKSKADEAERQAQREYQEGLHYYFGSTEGITIDYSRAAALFRRAADQRLPEAEARLGMLFHNGDGMAKDESKAQEWAKRAIKDGLETKAQNGNSRAQVE